MRAAAHSGLMCPKSLAHGLISQNRCLPMRDGRPKQLDVPSMVPCRGGLAARSGLMCTKRFDLCRCGLAASQHPDIIPLRAPARNQFGHIIPLRAASPHQQGTILGTSFRCGRRAGTSKEPIWAHLSAAGGEPAPARNHFGHIFPLRAASPPLPSAACSPQIPRQILPSPDFLV